MQIKQLLTDDSGVSPVIGVILMVAITVILAAVIASFVLTMGQEGTQTTPQASFEFNYNAAANNTTVMHDTGDPVKANELYVTGEHVELAQSAGLNDSDGQWKAAHASGSHKGTDAVVAGDSVDVALTNSSANKYKINVVWRDASSSQSATLMSDTGPDYE